MGRQIVQDDDVARLEGWSQLSLDLSFKNAPVHRRVKDEGGGQGVASQAGDEGLRLPMSERGFRKQPLPLQATAAQARHLGGRSGLVQEDQPVRLKPHPRLTRRGPFLARLLTSGRSCSLARRVFFEAIADAMSQRESEAGSAFSQVAAASSAASSGMVMSAFSATFSKETPDAVRAWRGVDRRSAWAQGFPATTLTRLTTKETDTLKCAAAAWRDDLHRQSGQPAHADQANTLRHGESPPSEVNPTAY